MDMLNVMTHKDNKALFDKMMPVRYKDPNGNIHNAMCFETVPLDELDDEILKILKAMTVGIDEKDINANPCSMLVAENGQLRCSLHKLGLKPTEGRLAHHSNTAEDSVNLRIEICKDWKDF